jgi:hypothetical protein
MFVIPEERTKKRRAPLNAHTKALAVPCRKHEKSAPKQMRSAVCRFLQRIASFSCERHRPSGKKLNIKKTDAMSYDPLLFRSVILYGGGRIFQYPGGMAELFFLFDVVFLLLKFNSVFSQLYLAEFI